MAQNDPSSKFKLKYIRVPEFDDDPTKMEEPEDTQTPQKKIPMALQLIQQQQQDKNKKNRTLNKKQRELLKIEQRKARIQMELSAVEIGFSLMEFIAQQ